MKHWAFDYFLILSLNYTISEPINSADLCSNLDCEDEPGGEVCGARGEGGQLGLRIFQNQCELLKYGCSVTDEEAYGLINMDNCERFFKSSNGTGHETETRTRNLIAESQRICLDYDCSYKADSQSVCAIRTDGNGFRVKRFKNKCQLIKYNCLNDLNFKITDLFVCKDIDITEDDSLNVPNTVHNNSQNNGRNNVHFKPVFVIDASMFNFNKNMNETIENFFAATHLLNLPVVNVQKSIDEKSRRMMVNIFGPQVVFQPWIKIPKNISEDYYHKPTLSSCFHKCPTKCPDTYAPVCGVPGIVAREPSLMFKNHCFMDVAQCKMHWENKSPTAESSYYIESSFVFCVGDQMSGMFRFLPVLRTLQHMGRLRSKGRFRYRMSNMRFLNNILPRQPNLMG